MRKPVLVILILLIASWPSLAQHLSIGLIAGTSVTDDLQPASSYFFQGGNSRSLIAGPMVEFGLSRNFSLEGDALYRALHGNGLSHFAVVTWEFPVLAKYKIPLRFATPFIEAGPSFRTAGNLNGSAPSHFGVTAGVGIEKRVGPLQIAPAIRYTHWGADGDQSADIRTRPNQIELVVGFRTAAELGTYPLGKRVSIGLVAGASVTDDFRPRRDPATVVTIVPLPGGGFGQSEVTGTFVSGQGSRSSILGPRIEIDLAGGVSLEADAIHRQMRSSTALILADGTPSTYPAGGTSIATWEFPVLAKYRLPVSLGRSYVRPFLEGGPSFRLPQALNGGHLATHGVTAGVGLEVRWHRVRVAPTVRYTYWGAGDPPGWTGTYRNQVACLLGLSF